jgi:hypothetical protein
MSLEFLNAFSANKPNRLLEGMGSPTESGAYNEEGFRYLLKSESKRSERSGHFYQILLVYRCNAQGAIVQLDLEVAQVVIAAMCRCLRETDYVGWYRKELIVGGVLTVVGRDNLLDVSSRLQPRLLETLRAELGEEVSHWLRIQVYQHDELERVDADGISFFVN